MFDKAKKLAHLYLQKPPETAGPRIVQLGIMGIILVNVAAVVIGTVPADSGGQSTLEEVYAGEMFLLELVSVVVFTAEYILRLWSITVEPRFSHPLWGRLRYACTPMAIIDLLAIAPFYVNLFGTFHTTKALVLRALRLPRIFRIFKLGHYSRAVRSLSRAIALKKAELLVTIFAVAILLLVASTVMYYAENEAQPRVFSSIPATMWWGIVTLTTVGYGDMTPVTALGKIAGAIVALFGIGLVALPAGILGSAFVQEIQHKQAEPARCPHCGKEFVPPR